MTLNEKKQNDGKVELGKFLTLFSESQSPETFLMPAGIIDETWHELLQSSSEYSDFLATNSLPNINHVETQGFGELKWVNEYHAKYGKLASVWFADKVQEIEYSQTGKLIASWDCGPASIKPKKKPQPLNKVASIH